MLEPGRIHTLTVDSVDERGIWLRTDTEPLFLPRREASAAVSPGEALAVFVFRDSSGQLRPTLRMPLAQVGEFALLTVRSVGAHGAFLDWGMDKDLLAPFSQQPERMEVGRRYLVRIAVDRQGRPFASAKLDEWLTADTGGELTAGAPVSMLLWQFTDLGAKMIVEHRWIGLLYRDELRPDFHPGSRLEGFIKRVREDGKLDVTLRKVGTEGVEEAKAAILQRLQSKGFVPLHDQSPPEAIQRLLGMSKKTFKKAVGGLYKAGLVELTPDGVRLAKVETPPDSGL